MEATTRRRATHPMSYYREMVKDMDKESYINNHKRVSRFAIPFGVIDDTEAIFFVFSGFYLRWDSVSSRFAL